MLKRTGFTIIASALVLAMSLTACSTSGSDTGDYPKNHLS